MTALPVYEWDSYQKRGSGLMMVDAEYIYDTEWNAIYPKVAGSTGYEWQPVGVTIGWYSEYGKSGCWHEAVT